MKNIAIAIAIGIGLSAPSVSWAQKDLVVSVKEDAVLAVSGYDVVSYHLGEPLKGALAHQLQHHGVTFRFANEENMALFIADPDRFAPLFDGQCVVSLSKGKDRPGNPRAFTFIDGKLVFVGGKGLVKKVDKDPDAILAAASQNWREQDR